MRTSSDIVSHTMDLFRRLPLREQVIFLGNRSQTERDALFQQLDKEEKIKILYHEHYRGHLKSQKVRSSEWIEDPTIGTVDYPKRPGKSKLLQNLTLAYIDSLTCVVPDDQEVYEQGMEHIFDAIYQGKNVFIAENHDIFPTTMFVVSQLYKYADRYERADRLKRPDVSDDERPNITDRIHVIVGPLLTVQLRRNSILSLANIKKTVPSTRNSAVTDPELQTQLNTLQSSFLRNVVESTKPQGNIYIMAPTGSRDYLKWSLYTTIESIMFSNDAGVKDSLGIIKKFAKSGNKIVMVGTNGVGLKRPSKTHAKNNVLVPADTYISLKEVDNDECLQLIENGTFMDTLAGLVKDYDGQVIGKTQAPDVIDYLWEHYTPPTVLDDCSMNFYFKDTIIKWTTRQLVDLLRTIKKICT